VLKLVASELPVRAPVSAGESWSSVPKRAVVCAWQARRATTPAQRIAKPTVSGRRSFETKLERRIAMISNRIRSQWVRMNELVKSKGENLYRALKEDWLAKLRLKDHYSERRPRSP
jgi:hypothetical protein